MQVAVTSAGIQQRSCVSSGADPHLDLNIMFSALVILFPLQSYSFSNIYFDPWHSEVFLAHNNTSVEDYLFSTHLCHKAGDLVRAENIYVGSCIGSKNSGIHTPVFLQIMIEQISRSMSGFLFFTCPFPHPLPAKDWTQGLVKARQALYTRMHPHSSSWNLLNSPVNIQNELFPSQCPGMTNKGAHISDSPTCHCLPRTLSATSCLAGCCQLSISPLMSLGETIHLIGTDRARTPICYSLELKPHNRIRSQSAYQISLF